MTKDEIRARVKAMLIEHLGKTEQDLAGDAEKLPIFIKQNDIKANIKAGTPQPESLGGDSLDWVELVMATEAEFGIEISDEDAENPELNSIDGLVAYLERHAG